MAFELPDLPYSHDALADLGMSQETLEYHHDLHHKAYVDNGNKLIAGTEWEGKSVEDIITGTYQAGAVAQNGIFNNASQHWNHVQFWEMMVIGVLPFELAWILDFVTGSRLLGMATYMFDAELPLYLRALSLFHIMLPVVMIFLLYRLGYDRRALMTQTLLIWVVLPVTYLVTNPADNINLVFGLGKEPQTFLHPLLYLSLEMVLLPVVICLPAHLVLLRLVGRR